MIACHIAAFNGLLLPQGTGRGDARLGRLESTLEFRRARGLLDRCEILTPRFVPWPLLRSGLDAQAACLSS